MSYEVFSSEPSHASEALGDLLGSLSGDLMRRAQATGSAYAVWASATGARERAHTMGVYLAEPDDATSPLAKRTLTVYVDSNAIMQDFRTNAELYLMKLSRAGLQLDGIEFRLSKKARPAQEATSLNIDKKPNVSRETISPATQKQLEEQLAKVENPALRASLSRAIGLPPTQNS